ncbi:MAG TPA: NAD-dependent epimerase/dehydratase family protein [Myxococcota bacterium]|nr:NAD-dependent epimerase/dehydratase family protein [Myxococcota bacterium]
MSGSNGRVLVTGAAGFIGSHLVSRLLDLGFDVLGLDSFCDFYDPAVKRANIATFDNNRSFRLFEADIRDVGAVRDSFGFFRPDIVIHLAAMAGVRPSIENPGLYRDVNVNGTAVILRQAVADGVRRILFASSSSVYGNAATVPFNENLPIDSPLSPYAETKISGERLCVACARQSGIPVTSLRLFTVFGPRQRPDLAISRFLAAVSCGRPIQVFGDGQSSRDYTYVTDIVDGIVSAIDSGLDVPAINLGNSHPVSLAGLIETVEQVCGRRAIIERLPMQPGDVDRTWADISLAGRVLGFVPRIGILDGVMRQWEWMKG